MSSTKLNDPLAPTYRRNYRTHLALEEQQNLTINGDVEEVMVSTSSSSLLSDNAPLLTSENLSSIDCRKPVDRNNCVKASFFLLGLVALLPWNFFITASRYWMFKFRNVSSESFDIDGPKTQLQAEFFSMLSIVSNVPFLAVLFLSTYVNRYIPQKERNMTALVIVTILFLSVTGLVVVDTDGWQVGFYRLTLVQMFVIASFGAWYQGGIMGLASIFPHDYAHICIIGQSAGGVLASLVEIVVLSWGVDPSTSALMYFIFALIVLSISIVTFVSIQSLDFFRFYIDRAQSPINNEASEGLEIKVSTKLLFRKVWRYCVTLIAIYLGTIGVFPGILVHVKSTSPTGGFWNAVFSPVACFLVFNVGDLLGRISTPMLVFKPNRESFLMILALARILFVPLLFTTNISPKPKFFPSIFDTDLEFIIVNALFAFTNGYLTSVAMVYGPKKVEYFLQERVGTILVAMLASGMSLGSIASLVFVRVFFPVDH